MPRIHASPSAPETNNSTLLAPETNTIAVDNKNGVIVPAVQQETSSPDCISHAQVLVRLFSAMCSAAALRVSSISKIVKDISSHDEFTATLFGSESWNRLSLQELSQPSMYFDECCSDANREFLKWPTTVLSYGKRLEQGRLMLRRMFVPHQVEVSFPSLDAAFAKRTYLSQKLFRNAARIESLSDFQRLFSGERKDMLSTLKINGRSSKCSPTARCLKKCLSSKTTFG
mmetsp:Transcript_31805/g.92110  ORF Transcript_31805/g.92110 Transcript_31805/m.92110 type:complete len:229 (-) Transcript_31805:87-773(-)